MPTHPKRDLVATLGPSSFQLAGDLARAGATIFRLNGSHMSPRHLQDVLQRVRRQVADIPIIVDLQGAKMRLGSFEPRDVVEHERFELSLTPTSRALPLPHAEVFRAVSPGNTLSCDDDRVRLRVDQCEEDRLFVTSLVNATLRPRKGVNVLEHPVELDDLTTTDAEQIDVCMGISNVCFAFSFMRDGREASWIRTKTPTAVVGKVERAEAIEALPSLALRVDAVWVCRGDLGAQLGLPRLAQWLAGFQPTSLPVPTLIAGQVLEHLTHHPNPTRSEVCHLHDLLSRGYAGLVLSDETAIGVDPLRAVQVARDLILSLAV